MWAGRPGRIVSCGYDRIRVPAPVLIGDTVTVTYEIVERDEAAGKAIGRVTCITTGERSRPSPPTC